MLARRATTPPPTRSSRERPVSLSCHQSRGWMKAEGAWLWMVKDWIDRRWVRMYQDTDRIIARMAKHGPGGLTG